MSGAQGVGLRMGLEAITKGRLEQPVRVILYGVDGLGKSTWGAGSPSPIFLCAESGTHHLDVARFPVPRDMNDVYEALDALEGHNHDFRSLVVDTLDWLERLAWMHVAGAGGFKSIEDFGYGKGYTAALEEWVRFTARLQRLVEKKRMNMILIAHAQIKQFKNPEGEDFDRYQLKLHDKTAALLREWVDCVLFANYETFATKENKAARAKGSDSGARFVYTQRRAAYDAKNRFNLPERLPLSWDDFFEALQGNKAPGSDLIATIEAKLAKLEVLDSAKAAKAREVFKASKRDAVKLAQIDDRLNAILPREEATA